MHTYTVHKRLSGKLARTYVNLGHPLFSVYMLATHACKHGCTSLPLPQLTHSALRLTRAGMWQAPRTAPAMLAGMRQLVAIGLLVPST